MKHQTILLSGYSARTERAGPLMLGTAGSYGNEQLQIRRGNGWEALNVRVVFHPCGAELLVPEDGILTVPWEATDSPLDRGQGRIVFQGVSEGRVIHTADLFYEVRPHSPVPGHPPREHVPVLSEELLKRVYEIGAAAESSARSAQSAEASASLASNKAQAAQDAQSAAASSAEEAKKAAGITLDATLTVEGNAADAKATGDAVGQLKSDLTALESIVTAIQEKLNSALPVDAVTVKEINDMLVEYFENKAVLEVEA